MDIAPLGFSVDTAALEAAKAAAADTANKVGQLGDAVDKLADQAAETDAAVKKTADTIKEAGDASKQTAASITETTKAQKELGDATTDTAKKISDTAKNTKDAAAAADDLNEKLKDVVETSKQVNSVQIIMPASKSTGLSDAAAEEAYQAALKRTAEAQRAAAAGSAAQMLLNERGTKNDPIDSVPDTAGSQQAQKLADSWDKATAKINKAKADLDTLNKAVADGKITAEAAAGAQAVLQKTINGVGDGADKAGKSIHATSGVVREAIVLMRELGRGNFTAMIGSATLLAQRMGLVDKGVKAVSDTLRSTPPPPGGGGPPEPPTGPIVEGGEAAEGAGRSMLGMGIIAGGTALAVVAVALAFEHMARSIGEANDEQARIQRSFANLNGVLGDGSSAVAAVDKQARDLGQASASTEAQVMSLAKSFEGFGGTVGEALIVQKALSQAFLEAGQTSGEAAKNIDSFAAAMKSGKVSGDALREILSNLPKEDVIALATAMGTTAAKLQETADQGKLTSSALEDGVEKAANSIQENLGNKVPETIEQANNKVSDSFGELKKSIDQSFNVTPSIVAAENAIAGLENNIAAFAEKLHNWSNSGLFNFSIKGIIDLVPGGAAINAGIDVLGLLGGGGKPTPTKQAATAADNASGAALRSVGLLDPSFDHYTTSGKTNETAIARGAVSSINDTIKGDQAQLTDAKAKLKLVDPNDKLAVAQYTETIDKLSVQIDKARHAATGASESLAHLTKPKKVKTPGPTAFDDLEQQTKEAQAALDFDPSSAGQSIYEAAEKAVRSKRGKASNGTLTKAIQDEVSNRLVKFRGTFGDQDEKAANDNDEANAYAGSGKTTDLATDAHFQALTAVYQKFGKQLDANNPIMKEAEQHFLGLAAAQQKLSESKAMNGLEEASKNSAVISAAYATGGAVAGKRAERAAAIGTATEGIYDSGQRQQMADDLTQQDTDSDNMALAKQSGALKDQLQDLKDQEALWGLIGDKLDVQTAVLEKRKELMSQGIDPNSAAAQPVLQQTADLAQKTIDFKDTQDKVDALKGSLKDMGTGVGTSLMAGFDRAFQYGRGAGRDMMVSLQNTALAVLDKIMQALVVNPAVGALNSAVGNSSGIGGFISQLFGGGAQSSLGADLGSSYGGGDASALMATVGLGIGGSMNGNVFDSGGLKAFMSGGVVSRPTKFLMSGGDMGMMGEAGPEAVVPLRRGSDGRLGVASGGGDGGGSQVIINDMRSGGSPVEVQQRQTGDGKRQMQVMIRDSVRQSISDGSFDSANASQYGISRTVTRR